MSGTMSRRETSVPRRWFEQGPLASLREEMDGLFESFFGAPELSGAGVPRVDLAET